MKKDSKKFPAVMTIEDVLGIEEGTILRFDWASGKYVSVEEAEDIAEDDYYYSGYAIAIDPHVVKDNIGTYFTYIEQNAEQVEESKDAVQGSEFEKRKVYSDEDALNHLKSEEELGDLNPEEAEKLLEEKEEKSYPLVVDCECGHRSFVKVIDAPGISFTLMAENDESFLELSCSECGSRLRMWFATNISV